MSDAGDTPIFDADQHMYETPEALTKFLPERYRRAVQFVQVGKRTRVSIMNKITDYIPNPTFERVAAPGTHEVYYASRNTEGLTLRQLTGTPIESLPAFRNPDDRVKELDSQGVEQCLNYPTLANLVEHAAASDPELTAAVIHAVNEWMREHWEFGYQDRVFSTPVLTLGLLDEALRELEYVLASGAKVALIRSAPVNGFRGWRSPALPEFDPFWREVESAGLPIVFHLSQPPLQDYIDTWEPAQTQSAFENSAFKAVAMGHRDIADMLASMICHGTLTRFPKLRVASVENGSSWIRPLLDELNSVHGKMPQNFEEHPVEVFRRNVWVSPFWEGSVSDVVDAVGWDKVMFGSDYPHPEGLETPKSIYKYAEDMDARRTYDFMGDNVRRFMGMPIRNPDLDATEAPMAQPVGLHA